ncbi:MAG: M23 family metallopeptidase [Anaerolineales bacterium]|nr:M23 family metallopeptidase [Anaerolineales bacterium]
MKNTGPNTFTVPTLLLLLVLAACGPAAAGETLPTLAVFATSTATPHDPAELQPPFSSSSQAEGTAVINLGTPAATPTPGTVRFDVPPAIALVSAWRPPLYPVPWAPGPYDHFYFSRPIAADEVNWPLPSYRYGGVFFNNGQVHTGVDISAEYGSDVIAAGPGTVIWADWGLFIHDPGSPYGRAVVLRHDFGYQGQPLFTVYAHLSEIDVIAGQWLDTGGVLGNVGDTGHATGPHLHFEVRVGSDQFFATYNPELWMAPPQGWGVLVGRVMDTRNSRLASYEVFVDSNETGQRWTVRTYGSEAINPDPYYNENLVLSDLPAGIYTIHIYYGAFDRQAEVQIIPGRVTFFTFRGHTGYDAELPPTPNPAGLITPIP